MNSADSFKNLQEYARYLKKNRVRELAKISVQLAKEHALNTPFKSDEEMLHFLIGSFDNFLSDIIEKNPIEGPVDTLHKSKALPVYYEMNRADIILAYKIRRHALNEFISEYTSDLSLQKEISREINILLLIIQKIAAQPAMKN
jgi:hypothetical protein